MSQFAKYLALLAVVFALVGCTKSSSGGAQGGFRMIEFLESGLNGIPRNRDLVFRFSGEVDPNQDFPERLKIQNVQAGQGQSDFSRSIGIYLCVGDEVHFSPRLPQATDRGDAGFRALGNYHVFCKAGPDSLQSIDGEFMAHQQEFLFDTSEFFEDPDPTEPPRAIKLLARDTSTDTTTDLSRLDPNPLTLAGRDSADLPVIDPGAGGPPNYDTRWVFELHVLEPLDPAVVTPKQVELFQIRENSVNGTESDVSFKVPCQVEMVQGLTDQGVEEYYIRITAMQTLVDNARYRLQFSGEILGIDFRKEFRGENGLTGDGQTIVEGSIYEEPGGLGYTTEFVVDDRLAINASRTVLYDPLVDGIDPEMGQTTVDEELYNTSLYNPASNPGTAVGFLADFGNGTDGSFAVSGGQTVILDTGDTPNDFIGNPFPVQDLNANDVYNKTTLATTTVWYDSPEYFELNLESLTISSSSTLRVKGVNPVLFRVKGVVQISGSLDLSGQPGQDGKGSNAAGGEAGAGGGRGAHSKKGVTCRPSSSACNSFGAFLNSCTTAKNQGPFAENGVGPGRGMGGGEAWSYGYEELKMGLTGTGGGGGSHAWAGSTGQDLRNAGDPPGSAGSTCAEGSTQGGSPNNWTRNSSVIGVRGMPGPTYGDREVNLITLGGSGGGAGGTQHANPNWPAAALGWCGRRRRRLADDLCGRPDHRDGRADRRDRRRGRQGHHHHRLHLLSVQERQRWRRRRLGRFDRPGLR